MTDRPVVLFVCTHGSAKSLLAKTLFERHARDAGVPFAAESRGTEPDAEVPPWMRARLTEAGIPFAGFVPRALSGADLAGAATVVTFDLPPAVTAAAPEGAPRERWDGLPAASEDFAASRAAIEERVRSLVTALADARRFARSS